MVCLRISYSFVSALALAMLCASARAQPADPSPDEIDSHEHFLELFRESRAASYQHVLATYDRWLEANPSSARAALERCRFIQAVSVADPDDTEDEGLVPEAEEDCSAQLVARFPEVPAVMQFRMDRLWGAAAVQYGEAVFAKRSMEWTSKQKARFFKSLAFAFLSQDKLANAVYSAKFAQQFDPTPDFSIIFAREFKRQGRTRDAIDTIAKAGLGDPDHAHEKLTLLLECNAFPEALAFIDAMQGAKLFVPSVQKAQALEGVGRTEAARELYLSSAQPWNRERVLVRLFYIDVDGSDRARAIASYEALRDIGFQIDPFLRHRLALALAFPTAPWHLRDALGLLGLVALGLLVLVLPCFVILPVHYIGLVRRERTQTAPPTGDRWSLFQLWAVCAGYLIASTCATYLFMYAELDKVFSHNALAEPSRTEIARATLWSFISTSLAVLAWLRRGDIARLLRSSWSPKRIVLSTLRSVLLILLVQGVAIVVSRVVGWSPSDSVLAVGSTTREAVKAVLREYGVWPLVALAVVLVPLAEELMFREIWLTTLARQLPFPFANALQAGVFTLLHDEPIRFPALFTLAWIAGRITRRSGGLLPAICLHMTVNLLATLAIYVSLGSPPAAPASQRLEGMLEPLSTTALLEKCKHGDHAFCSDAGERYEHDNAYERAFEFYQQACDGGVSSACYRLGRDYAHGVHVKADRGRAAVLLERACAQGASGGCNQRGLLHETAYEFAAAAELYKKACDLDRPEGCFNLGRLYYAGQGVVKDREQVTRLFKVACDQELAEACRALGAD